MAEDGFCVAPHFAPVHITWCEGKGERSSLKGSGWAGEDRYLECVCYGCGHFLEINLN
jgi:hypothetical protein